MAADVTGGDAEPLLPAVQPPAEPPAETHVAVGPGPSAQGQRWPHRARFLVVYGVLGLALGGAVAGIVVFASRSINPAPAWSAWRPHGGGQGAAKEIATHLGAEYRLPSGKQLVDVIAKAPSVSPGKTTVPIHYVAVRTTGQHYETFDVSPTTSVMYSLCGLGPSCSIATGTPSVARGRLVRREILELALYTFKYVPGMQSVIAFMPPAAGTQPKYVVYLRKSDLSQELKVPLVDTLRAKTPLPNTIPAREVRLVDAVTSSKYFSFTLSQTQLGDAVLVLAPLPA